MLRRLISLCALLGLTACAAPQPTAYQPADGGTWGYSEQWLDDGSLLVRFAGNPATPRDTVESYALARAAEVTQLAGGDRFIIEDKTLERNRETYVEYWPSPWYRPGVYRPYYPPVPDRYSREFFSSVLRIHILKPGDPPDPKARDAAAVLERLAPLRGDGKSSAY